MRRVLTETIECGQGVLQSTYLPHQQTHEIRVNLPVAGESKQQVVELSGIDLQTGIIVDLLQPAPGFADKLFAIALGQFAGIGQFIWLKGSVASISLSSDVAGRAATSTLTPQTVEETSASVCTVGRLTCVSCSSGR